MTATLDQLPNTGDKIRIVYQRKDNRLTDTSGIFQGVSDKDVNTWMIQIEKHIWEISNIITWKPVITQ